MYLYYNMTSSWNLAKRREMGGGTTWACSNFGDVNNALGGWEDYYIINGAHRECHPNYEAMPMGNPYGMMICKRRKKENGDDINTPEETDFSQFNGYHKFSADLYRPWMTEQIQMNNPYEYYDRVIPNEEEFHLKDYISREIRFNGTGVAPMHTRPGITVKENINAMYGKGCGSVANPKTKYHEYGVSYTHRPPYKYDISRLHQLYPIWKQDKIYHASNSERAQQNLDNLDRNYDDAVTASTW